MNCKFSVRGKNFSGAAKSVVFRDDGDIILIEGEPSKISIYIGL